MSFSHFEIFELSPTSALSISEAELEKKFYALSRLWHPDRNLSNPDEANLRSSRLNEAYETLRDPWKKASYLLNSLGLEPSKSLPTELAEIYFGLQEDEASREDLLQFLKTLEKKRDVRERALRDFYNRFQGPFEKSSPEFAHLQEWVAEESYAKSMEKDLRAKLSACGDLKTSVGHD